MTAKLTSSEFWDVACNISEFDAPFISSLICPASEGERLYKYFASHKNAATPFYFWAEVSRDEQFLLALFLHWEKTL